MKIPIKPYEIQIYPIEIPWKTQWNPMESH